MGILQLSVEEDLRSRKYYNQKSSPVGGLLIFSKQHRNHCPVEKMYVILTLLCIRKMEIYMNRKKYLRKQERDRRLIIMMFAIPITIAIVAITGTIIKEKIAAHQEQKAMEAEIAEMERLEEERQQAIEEALEESKYGADLRNLYEEYPQIEDMILNLEDYPDELIEYFIKMPETVEWVINYPEYSAKSEEELN